MLRRKPLLGALSLFLSLLLTGALGAEPVVLRHDAPGVGDRELHDVIKFYRRRSQAFVFLSGGASKMDEATKAKLLGLFDAFEVLARRGLRFAVGDGGTDAGIMAAAGKAKAASGGAFLLVGVSPGPEVLPEGAAGKTPLEPHHDHVVAVFDAEWAEQNSGPGGEPPEYYWGSETRSMYDLFGALTRGGVPSLAIVANGGGITLDEVAENIADGRRMIVIQGSGRSADAIASLVLGTPPPDDEEVLRRLEKARAIGVPEHKELFSVFDLEAGPEALADAISLLLEGGQAL